MARRGLLGLAAAVWSRAASAASWVASDVLGFGSGYQAVDPRRKVQNGRVPPQQTANQVLTSSLPALRSHCRQLERNNPTARAGIEGLAACVIGTGIALEPDTGDARIDKLIRAEWEAFACRCSVDDRNLFDLEHLGFREMVSAGESLWRLVVLPERIDEGLIPLAVLVLEPEWIDPVNNALLRHPDGSIDVNGIRVDAYGRPLSYRLRHPEYPTEQAETVPAAEVVHVFERRRALQSRGEPWLAPVIETLNQEQDLVAAELCAAKTTAAMAMVITSEAQQADDTDEDGTTDDPAQAVRLGGVARLYPGEDIKALAHTRPAQQIAPFRQMLRGDIAAALRLSQRFLDRDVSRANYSSMRSDNLDTERLLAPVREWFGHATAGRLYRAALPYLALKAGVKTPRATYRLIPDGQPYVDPLKDAQAAIAAIAGGLSTFEAEIGKRGGDRTATWTQLAKEHAEAKKLGLVLDLSGANAPAPDSTIGDENPTPAKTPKQEATP